MLFDEARREILVSAYQKLSEDEQIIYRVLAVVFIPVNVTKLTEILNIIRNSEGFRHKWKAQPAQYYTFMLKRWEREQLAERCVELHGEGWACSQLLTEIAARDALHKGEYEKFDDAAEKVLKLSPQERMNSYRTVTEYLRVARKVFYQGNVQGYERLGGAEIYSGHSRYGQLSELSAILQILGNPVQPEWVSSLPPRIGNVAFLSLLRATLGDAGTFRELFAAFDEYRVQHHKTYPSLTVEWAEFAVLDGRIEEAARETEKTKFFEKYSIAGMNALLQGDRESALEFYEEGISQFRKAKGRRRVGYYSWTGVFYPILLLSSGASVKKIENYLLGTETSFSGHLSPTSLELLRYLFPSNLKAEKLFQTESALVDRPERCIDAFFFILYAFWLNTEKARRLRLLAEATFESLESLGMNFLVTELSAVIRELWPDSPEKYHRPSPPYPVKDLLSRQSEWERSLSALSGIGGVKNGVGTTKGAKRFAWEIQWGSVDRVPTYVQLTPMEQTLQAAGWSKGKNVALKRLYSKASTIPGMTDQDYRAASAIREEYSYHGLQYYIDAPQALEALAGHPYLFHEDGSRVEVVTDEPQLTAAEEKDSYHLKLSPFPKGDSSPQHVLREDGPSCLRVTRFEERHVKIAMILGEKGLRVPGRAKETLLKTLGSLASVVTVHSDLEGVEANARQVEADSRVYVQIQPSDDGLDVDLVVRPLGPNSVPCRPGVGGNNIFGLVDSNRVQARRDLEKEKDELMCAVRACPALVDAEQVSEGRWHLQNPELALEFLVQVQELGDTVVVEWPKGQTMRVRSQISASAMSVAVRSAQDWFSFSGELKVDERLVLSMKELMDLLKVGHGRFLPIGDGQFIALTKEFRRRLEALSALGDPKGDELRVSPLSVGILAPLAEEAGSFKSSAEWDRQRARISEAANLNPSLPSTFKGELRNYQLEGYQWLSRLAHWGAGACLADDMGLGKTIQALALLVARGKGGPALVIAPTSVCPNWIAEANRFAPTLNMTELRNVNRKKILKKLGPLDVVVTTYGLLQNEIELLSAVQWHTVVLDEAQAIKNMGTKRSAAAMKLMGDFRMVTTGTPIENHLSELWNLFRFLNPHFLGSFEGFNRRFAIPIERDDDKGARLRLKKVIQPFILRRNKEQVLEELPPKTEITLRVEMKEEEQAFYEALRRSSVEKLSSNEAVDQRFQIFAELMRLRRACCNVALVMGEGEGEGEGKENTLSEKFPSAKLEAFSEILGELRENGHKALVFSQFVDHLSILRKYLDRQEIPYQYLDGSTPPQERTKRVAAFQAGEGDCFLISLKAGGTGLNLTAADYVIHMDPWWNPALEEQASDRAHRIGQDRPVTVYRIVAKDTIEEKIVDLHTWKRDLAESLLDESEAPLRLSAEEMLELIREAR
ncbi:MAG: DEAD/DEAH box helicase [Synergistaceae bacterium]|nr:DEAD/DEAH box helicase [Synergistaceae bacterium]